MVRANDKRSGSKFGSQKKDDRRSAGKLKFEKSEGKRSLERSKIEKKDDKRKLSDGREQKSFEGRNFTEDIPMLEGRNPVLEAIKAGRTIEKLLVAKGMTEGSIRQIISMAREKGIVINEVERQKLDAMSETGSHQGVIAVVSPYTYVDVEDILEYAKKKGEDPFIVILDEIHDPHNLGSILRTANVSGVHGIIIPKRRAVGLTPAVAKASAGAVEYVKVAKVTNISQTIKYLKDQGVWVVGADMDGQKQYFDGDYKGPIAIVIGNEGEGISRLIKDNCDYLVKIPMKGQVSSLNAGVAGAIMMYEVFRQRLLS